MMKRVVNDKEWENYTILWNDFAEVFPALVKNECDEKAKQLTRQLKMAFDKIFEYAEDETEDLDTDKVNHPSHYTWLKDTCGIEAIDIARHMDFDLGNAIKYIIRQGHKSEKGISNKEKAIQDLKKAIWYINDKIEMLKH